MRWSFRLAKQPPMDEALFCRAAPLLEAEVDDEIVALDRAQGEVFGFNAVASDIWRLLERPRTIAELCGELIERYEVPAERCAEDVEGLLGELIEMKLIKRIPKG